jgi:hypothetical protein
MMAIKSLLALTLFAASAALAKPCVNFDSDFNLYVFGGNADYSLGPQDGWFSPSERFSLSLPLLGDRPGY